MIRAGDTIGKSQPPTRNIQQAAQKLFCSCGVFPVGFFRSHFSDILFDRQNVLPVLVLIIHRVHALFDDQDPHAADRPILYGLRRIRICFCKRIISSFRQDLRAPRSRSFHTLILPYPISPNLLKYSSCSIKKVRRILKIFVIIFCIGKASFFSRCLGRSLFPCSLFQFREQDGHRTGNGLFQPGPFLYLFKSVSY